MNLRQFLDSLPRRGVSEFATRVERSEVYLSQLAERRDGREASPRLSVVIERESNYQVRRWDLRPDDWHLIWPELMDDKAAPAVPAKPASPEPQEV